MLVFPILYKVFYGSYNSYLCIINFLYFLFTICVSFTASFDYGWLIPYWCSFFLGLAVRAGLLAYDDAFSYVLLIARVLNLRQLFRRICVEKGYSLLFYPNLDAIPIRLGK